MADNHRNYQMKGEKTLTVSRKMAKILTVSES